MKKTLSFISVLVLVTGAFVSCGDKEDKGSSEKKEKKAEKGIVGTWVPSGDTLEEMEKEFSGGMSVESAELVITETEMSMNASINASDLFCVTDDGFNLSGQSFDMEYDGEVITVVAEGQELAEFERVDDPDEDNVYGKYKNDEMSDIASGGEMIFDFAESGVSYMIISMKEEYTYDEETSKITTTDADGETEEVEYKVDGDTLTITDEDGKVETFTRAE